MEDAEGKMKEMFLALRAHMKKEQFSKCIEVCNQIFSLVPGDVDALRVKISCLVALNKIEEALALCNSIKELSFEKAYCLYRLNKVLIGWSYSIYTNVNMNMINI
jgi:signal recognition particle subunit SRP72